MLAGGLKHLQNRPIFKTPIAQAVSFSLCFLFINGGNPEMTLRQFPTSLLPIANNRQEIFGSMAPLLPTQNKNPVPNLVDAYHKLASGDIKTGLTDASQALSNAFSGLDSQGSPPLNSMQLSPVRGPSVEQSTALAKLLETMKPKFNSGGTL